MVAGNMKADNFDFSSVMAVSGSGQQHGTVYWANGEGIPMRRPVAPCHLSTAFPPPASPPLYPASTSPLHRYLALPQQAPFPRHSALTTNKHSFLKDLLKAFSHALRLILLLLLLAAGSQNRLGNLSADKTLEEQLQSAFSRNDSPIWMDSSTTRQVGCQRSLAVRLYGSCVPCSLRL